MTGSNDPIERMVGAALLRRGIEFRHNDPLDFECDGFAVEVTQFWTRRKIKQLEGREDVIFIQGRAGAEAFVRLLEN